jgi:hypothetical protein
MHQASEWSNHGALQLAAGHLGEACTSFATALTLLGDGNAVETSEYESHLLETSHVECFLLTPIDVAASTTVSRKAEEHEACIYTKALTIQNPSRRYLPEDVWFLRAVVNFNTGLACHLKAYHEDKQEGIREAFRFYRAGMQDLKAYPAQDDPRTLEYSTILAVAFMNNMAQALLESNQFEKAAVLMRSVRTLLSSLEDITVTFDPVSLESFVWNEFFFSFTSCLVRGAPAA